MNPVNKLLDGGGERNGGRLPSKVPSKKLSRFRYDNVRKLRDIYSKPIPDTQNKQLGQFQNSNYQNTFSGFQMQPSTSSSKVKNRRLILEG
jgi:hypothetical protein